MKKTKEGKFYSIVDVKGCIEKNHKNCKHQEKTVVVVKESKNDPVVLVANISSQIQRHFESESNPN
jgi:hypothetical protein